MSSWAHWWAPHDGGGDARGGRASSAKAGADGYFALAGTYFRPGSRAAQCVDAQRAQPLALGGGSNFFTVGLEGSGHHLFETLDKSLCGGKPCGGQESYSVCGIGCAPFVNASLSWRVTPSATPIFPDAMGVKVAREYGDRQGVVKYIVLVRDPVDAFTSAARRFWQPNVVGSLQREFEVLNASMAVMDSQVQRLPCARTLFLGFEMISRYGPLIAPTLAAFLGVNARDERLANFLRKPASRTRLTAPRSPHGATVARCSSPRNGAYPRRTPS